MVIADQERIRGLPWNGMVQDLGRPFRPRAERGEGLCRLIGVEVRPAPDPGHDRYAHGDEEEQDPTSPPERAPLALRLAVPRDRAEHPWRQGSLTVAVADRYAADSSLERGAHVGFSERRERRPAFATAE
jgi:hypothetical protein